MKHVLIALTMCTELTALVETRHLYRSPFLLTERSISSPQNWKSQRNLAIRLAKSASDEGESIEVETLTKMGEIAAISSPWLSIYCERLADNTGQVLDYWRVEKPSSCIVIVICEDRFILPKPQYRPGMGRVTLDFCGGRCDANCPQDSISFILKRELDIDIEEAALSITDINQKGWMINSSFSNQQLFGFVVHLNHQAAFAPDSLMYANGSDLLYGPDQLTCLQCRALLLEWLMIPHKRK